MLSAYLFAQKGVGFRFATDLFFFPRNPNFEILQGTFSVICVGPKFKSYNDFGGIELGVNFLYKEHPGGFNLPGVMNDFRKGNSTAWTSYEMDFRFGPRLWKYFYPKTGYRLGWRPKAEGFVQNRTLNEWYLILPLGFTIELPTQFGSTGFGFFWDIGITNLVRRPAGFFGDYNGGRIQGLNIEINVLVGE